MKLSSKLNEKKAKWLISILEKAHLDFLEKNEVAHDALAPALKYHNKEDKEFAAFICSILAYGRIAQIKKSIEKILEPMGTSPVHFLVESKDKDLNTITKDWKHRFNTHKDILIMLKVLRSVYSKHRSLENWLSPQKYKDGIDLNKAIYDQFLKELSVFSKVQKSFFFFIPNPYLNGASKRMNLFFKWMVRDEEPDLGLWKSFDKSKLIIPLDTHIHKQALSLGFTKRRAGDLRTAIEVTEALKKLTPTDPTKYDFALCHLGVHGEVLE